ncbi:Rv1535 family protein [Candidatus Mycobacterium wuenschmannii]|uniref:Rv1535 family protein n=1 Tax=Candidatus Mycobacterium wuenschmannii TaxID=3027808 RepID=A0ABY8VYP5_9MYCO|nr:Rv1535 family protein [Candidatus Mycobacterium wuenschmannii]WIM88723.1 Rv1535 family protein [Candidatus Mycobacterium wuenschmannii]
MTAALYDDVVVPISGPRLTVVPDTAPAAQSKPKTAKRPSAPLVGDDPLVNGAARLLCVPLRQLYAALWRAGVIDVSA